MTVEAAQKSEQLAGELIFIIEDDIDISSLIEHTMKQAGYSTRVFADGRRAVEAINKQLPALILLDGMLPGLDGLEVLRCLEGQQRTRGIRKIMLSARTSEQDKVSALELGADDYITKPFSPRELVARVRVVLKAMPDERHRTVQIGNLIADLDARRVTLSGNEIICTATEFNVLAYFMRHPGRVLSRDRLLEKLWPSDKPIEDSRIVDVYVRRLREKIEADPANPRRIVTRRRDGYVMVN